MLVTVQRSAVRSEAGRGYTHDKAVDSPNANAKFSRRKPSKSNITTLDKESSAPRSPSPRGSMRGAHNHTDPFDPDRTVIKPSGVRIVSQAPSEDPSRRKTKRHFNVQQAQKADANKGKLLTAYGVAYGGKQMLPDRHTNDLSTVRAHNETMERSAQRVRHSPRSEANILIASTLTSTVKPKSSKRFGASASTLEGVFFPVPLPSRLPYKVIPPWHTEAL